MIRTGPTPWGWPVSFRYPAAMAAHERQPQEYYDAIKARFAEERDLRLAYRPEGTAQFVSDLDGDLARIADDPYATEITERDPIDDEVEVLIIGGGFSALLTSARLREFGVESIRIVERGADVGGTWYWNRYPGVACDVPAYDYLPLLDELDYVPTHRYAGGQEIWDHCRAIARKYDLYDLAVFQTTVTSTMWDEATGRWHIGTDRGDRMRAKFVICANGTLSKPKLSRIAGMETFAGHAFHTSRWDFEYTGANLEKLGDKVVGIIGTGATAVQAIPHLGAQAKELVVFQRTPSTIDFKEDWPTDPNWARRLQPGWQSKRRERVLRAIEPSDDTKARWAAMSPEQKLRDQEQANIDRLMRIHRRIEETVHDPATAESLKPWYMIMCKRPCFHNEYLPTFNRPNVHLVDTRGRGVTEIRPEGPVFEDRVYPLDLLIYATGFEVQKTGIWNRIVGRDGLDLDGKYADGIRTVFGIHTAGFPNLFIMGGYQASFQFNLTDLLAVQGDHIAACIDHVRRSGRDVIDASADAEQWWVDEVISNRGKTRFSEDCTPGYYNFEGEFQRRQDGNYNGGFRNYNAHLISARDRFDRLFELA